MRYVPYWCGIAVLIAAALWLPATAAAAQNQMTLQEQRDLASKYQLARPVYLDIRSANEEQSVLSRQQIAAMAKQAVEEFGESTILMQSDVLPDTVRVLRIIYIVREQSTSQGAVIAASAKVELLRTTADKYSTVLATSIYSGLQQTLIQAADSASAEDNTRKAFKNALDKRIAQAFTDTAAQ